MTNELNLDELLRKGRFAHAWLATYNFGASFFERYCLERYEPLALARSIVVFLDHGQHEALLSATPEERPHRSGIRYVLCPIRCHGVFHAKLALFAGEDAGLLVLGSANLTRNGLTQNAEYAVALRFDGDHREHLAQFGDALRFFAALADQSRSPSVRDALERMCRECGWLTAVDDGSPTRPRILHSLTQPLWPQVRGALRGPPVRCSVLSPYFDAAPRILDELAPDLADAQVHILTQSGPWSLSPRWLAHPTVGDGRTALHVTTFGEVSKPRALHAKAVLLADADEALLAYGSANFTIAGWCSHQGTGNVETVLRVRGLPSDLDVTGWFDPRAGQRLASTEDLIGGTDPPPVRPPPPALRLIEASLDEQTLRLCMEPMAAQDVRWAAVLLPSEGEPIRVSLAPGRDDAPTAPLDAGAVARCTRGVTIVQMLGSPPAGATLTSNQVFLLQLRELGGGRAARIERRIQEAQEDPEAFAAVLDELTGEGDLEGLRRLFWCCELRIGGGGRTVFLARGPVTGDRRGDMHPSPDLAKCLAVYDQAREFVETHLHRLHRHAQNPAVAALPRYVMVARSVAVVLAWQLGVLLADLKRRPLRRNAEQWGVDRKLLNACVQDFARLISILRHHYLPKLRQQLGQEALPLEWQDCAATLHRHAEEFMQTRKRIDTLGLRIKAPMGVLARFFQADILEDTQWRTWVRELDTAISELTAPPQKPRGKPKKRPR